MAEIVIKLVNGELAGKTMQQITKEVSASALALKKAEIGTKEWLAANEKLDKAKQLQADMKKQIEGTTKASDQLKKAWNNLPGAAFFNQISDSFGMMKSGVGGLVSQFGVLKTAIAATGIGLLLIAVASLISLFKNFTPVIDKVEQILGGISSVMNELTQRVQNFGAGLLKIITGAPGGVDQLTSSFKGLGDSIKGAYEEGVKLAELQQDLDDRNRGIAISNAQAVASIDKLIAQSKNRTIAEKERMKFLDQAEEIAISKFEKEKKLDEDNYKASIMLAMQKSKLSEAEILQLAEGTLAQDIEYAKRGSLDDDLLQKITDNRVKMINLEGAVSLELTKIDNARDKIREAREAKADKERERTEKENAQFLKDQEKFYEEQHKLQEQEDLFQENRRAANLEKEKQNIKAGMLAALDSIQKQTDASKEAQAEKKAIADAQAAIQAEELAVFNEGVNSVVALLASSVKSRKKYANEIKTLQVGQVAVNGITEVSEIAKTFAELGPIGQILAAFRIAFSVARTAAGISRINAQKFELGGMINGPRHSQGGVPLEAEGGEFIFSRKSVAAIGANVLSSINNRYTRRFEAGGPVNPFTNISSATGSNPPSSSAGQFSATDDLKNTFIMYATAMDKRIDRIMVVNNLQETEKGLATLNQLRNEADV